MPRLRVWYVPDNKLLHQEEMDAAALATIYRYMEPCSVRDAQGDVTVRFRGEHAVPDMVRYLIAADEVKEPFGRLGVSTAQYLGVLKGCILMLLESPHRDEYGTLLQPLAPAAGSTGDNLRRHMELLREQVLAELKGVTFDTPLPFVIMNAVPFPTSCMTDPLDTALRKRVFDACAVQLNLSVFLRERLRRYKPAVVLNAVTGDFRHGVTEVLQAAYPDLTVPTHTVKIEKNERFLLTANMPEAETGPFVVDIAHPSGWRLKKAEA